MDKYFDFVNKPNSFIAGTTYIVSINVILSLIMIPVFLISKYFDFAPSIGFVFFILYFFNISSLSKNLFILIGLKMANGKILKMDIGSVCTSLILAILIAWISILKFNLLPLKDGSNILLLFCIMMTVFNFGYAGITGSKTSMSNASLTTDESKIDSHTTYIEKKKLIKLNICFILASALFGFTFIYFIF